MGWGVELLFFYFFCGIQCKIFILYIVVKYDFGFRLLTGDEILSNGNAFLLGKNLVQDRSSFLSMIGYCPQFDSIIEVLTGREMLLLLARLRGIKEDQAEAEKWLKELGKLLIKFYDLIN